MMNKSRWPPTVNTPNLMTANLTIQAKHSVSSKVLHMSPSLFHHPRYSILKTFYTVL